MKRVQIWLRLDQAECMAHALAYVCARFQDHGDKTTQQPAIALACKLADERADEVYDIVLAAITKHKGTK